MSVQQLPNPSCIFPRRWDDTRTEIVPAAMLLHDRNISAELVSQVVSRLKTRSWRARAVIHVPAYNPHPGVPVSRSITSKMAAAERRREATINSPTLRPLTAADYSRQRNCVSGVRQARSQNRGRK